MTLMGRAVLSTTVGAFLLGALPAHSGERRTELGLHLAGLNVVSEEGETVTFAGVPAPGLTFVGSAVYLSYFVSEKLTVEPQLGVFFISDDGDSSHTLSLAARLSYLAKGRGSPSLYIFGEGTLLNADFDGSQTDGGLGGGIGFRFPIRDAGALRVEGKYDRFFDNGVDVFGFTIGLGLMF